MKNKILKNLRFYGMPILATALAVYFWATYGGKEYAWWLGLIILIAILHFWVYFSEKKRMEN